MTSQLAVEVRDHVLVLTLNRPAQRNALTEEMVSAWVETLSNARVDPDVRVIVVTGSGAAFCSGADFSMIRKHAYPDPDAGGTSGPNDSTGFEHFAHRVAVAMDDLDKPVIAAVNGPAVGAGLGMALMADLRFLSDRARVAEGYINIGAFPGDGDTYFLPRIVGISRALMMFWTGDFVSADECLHMGLADRVFPHYELLPQTFAFAERLATRPQLAVRAVKRATYAGVNMRLRDALGMIQGYRQAVSASPDRLQALQEYMAAHPQWEEQ